MLLCHCHVTEWIQNPDRSHALNKLGSSTWLHPPLKSDNDNQCKQVPALRKRSRLHDSPRTDMGDPGALVLCLVLAALMKASRSSSSSSTRSSTPRSNSSSRGNLGRAQRAGGVFIVLLVLEVVVDAALYPTLSPLAGSYLSPELTCHQDSVLLRRSLKNRTLWAERMLDASARGVVGGLWGSRFQLGRFDACLAVGAKSPVGARYCLATLTTPNPTCPAATTVWDDVDILDPDSDAMLALQGCGLVSGSAPLSEVKVALCVPSSCGPAALQAALQASLQRSSFQVRVLEEHCVDHSEKDAGMDRPALIFWTIFTALTFNFLLAPYFGWSSWDWRRHVQALSKPDSPVSGLDLSALSGLRTINMFLVIGAHKGFHTPRLPHSNIFVSTAASRTSPWEVLAHHASLLVDTCFFMSGLLLAVSSDTRRPAKAIVNRYLRLTPSYAFVMLFYVTAMESYGSGPIWKAVVGEEAAGCRRWWWSNLLYVNNYVRGESGETLCMLQSWSLAVDVQLLVLGLALLSWLHGRGPRFVLKAVSLAVVLAALPLFLATLLLRWPPMFIWTEQVLRNPYAEPKFFDMYIPTHMRAAPYVVGLGTGLAMLHLKERRVELSESTTCWVTWGSTWALFCLMVSSVLFGDLKQEPWPPLAGALYASLSPVAWAIALGALVVCLTLGKHTAVRGFLRWQPLVTLSRLTYGVYMLHFALQLMQGAAERNPVHVTANTVLRGTFSDTFLSMLISFWLYLAVEAPMRHLAKSALAKLWPNEEAVNEGGGLARSSRNGLQHGKPIPTQEGYQDGFRNTHLNRLHDEVQTDPLNGIELHNKVNNHVNQVPENSKVQKLEQNGNYLSNLTERES